MFAIGFREGFYCRVNYCPYALQPREPIGSIGFREA